MILTNNLNLPLPVVAAVKADAYDRGECDYSVTELLSPPRIAALRRQHDAAITEDASERIWSLIGQCAHTLLERAGGATLSEFRGTVTIAGKRVSGQLDTLNLVSGVLSDYKVTTAWNIKSGGREEWTPQLNAYALIAAAHGHAVSRLEVTAILRDWSKLEARRSADYPQAQVAVLPIETWGEARTRSFFADRIALHDAAHAGNLPDCTAEERWQKPTTFAVMREGRKSALRVLETAEEAQAWRSTNAKPTDKIVRREGESIRCAAYCPVSAWCDWWQQNKPKDQPKETEA